jgi:hypothetical protein
MKTKTLKIIAVTLIVLFLISGTYWIRILRKAHSSFENYYSFRGCVELLNKTDNSGYCITESDKIIKLVKFNEHWYLDDDLPTCWKNICF